MTINEFLKGRGEKETYLVAVLNHKTLSTSGPAMLCFTTELYNITNRYLKHFRSSLEGLDVKKTHPLFISWSGKKLSSSMVTAQLNSFWNKGVGATENRPRFHATLVRKSSVTTTHTKKPEMKADLANLMCHSQTTAGKSYFLQEKSKNAATASTELRNLLRDQCDIDIAIEKHFKEDIENEKITMTIVKEKKHLSPSFEEYTDLQLRDKTRYIISNS